MLRTFPAVLMLLLTGCSPTERVAPATATFTLTSAAFREGGVLPVVYTCDGTGSSPPLVWTGAPAGTVQFALLMT
ncbi:MAG: YbhB/YbcL family Raf kinase inhibitor-like protein, partial [Deltaproteobacteria bacterium]